MLKETGADNWFQLFTRFSIAHSLWLHRYRGRFIQSDFLHIIYMQGSTYVQSYKIHRHRNRFSIHRHTKKTVLIHSPTNGSIGFENEFTAQLSRRVVRNNDLFLLSINQTNTGRNSSTHTITHTNTQKRTENCAESTTKYILAIGQTYWFVWCFCCCFCCLIVKFVKLELLSPYHTYSLL